MAASSSTPAAPGSTRRRPVEPAPEPRIRTTKGVHIACEPFTEHAVALESAVDGRAGVRDPLGGSYLVGTTDTDFDGDPARRRRRTTTSTT